MAPLPARIQVCGRIAVEVNGARSESLLPGPQGRIVFAFLVLHRTDPVSWDMLADAVWDDEPPAASITALHALVSKVRRVLPCRTQGGRVCLDPPDGTWVDLEAARDAIHRAESAIAQKDWPRAWGSAQTALFTARRGFLSGHESLWAQTIRAEITLLHQRALESYATAALGVGRTELFTAERAGRELLVIAPYRESGYRLLMSTLAAQGNVAEAVQLYENLRRRLRDDLGIVPSAQTRSLHTQLIAER